MCLALFLGAPLAFAEDRARYPRVTDRTKLILSKQHRFMRNLPDCRDVLGDYANDLISVLSYDDARVVMFHKLDVLLKANLWKKS